MKDNNIILINYTGRNGAGPVDAYEMTRGFLKCGKKVAAIISENCSNIQKWQELKLEKLVLLHTYNGKKDFFSNTLKFWFFERKRISQDFKKYNIEFIYCPMFAFWTHLINRIFPQVKKCVVNHDPVPHRGDKMLKLSNMLGMQKVYKEADVIVVHSKIYIKLVSDLYHKKGQVIHIPLGRQNYYKNLDNKFGNVKYDKNKINFLFFGRLEAYKGLNIIALAYRKLSVSEANISLTVVGAGDFKPYEQLYQELPNLTLINRWIDDREVESFFTGENIVLLAPYLNATQSGPVLLALEYGIPSVVSRVGGLSEQVEDGKTGKVIAPNEVDALVGAMKDIMKFNKENMQKEIEKKRNSLEWSSLADKLLTALQQ